MCCTGPAGSKDRSPENTDDDEDEAAGDEQPQQQQQTTRPATTNNCSRVNPRRTVSVTFTHHRRHSSQDKNQLLDWDKELRRRSKLIDKELKKSDKVLKATIKLLLLGTGESGKSTILKQMRIIHAAKFTIEEKLEKIYDIKSNIRDSILSILEAMEHMNISFSDSSLVEMKEYIYENIHLFTLNNIQSSINSSKSSGGSLLNRSTVSNSAEAQKNAAISIHKNSYSNNDDKLNQRIEKTWLYIEKLWQDSGVKKCAKRGNEYHLIDSAEYFLDRVNIIKQPDYLPNEQDILRCRVLTTGIQETKFDMKKVNFHVFDVGGQRDQRRKWIQCFNQVTAIIYVVDISSFNMTLREDNQVNRLRESLQSFRQIWINRYLYHISIILFLNKYDLFVKKILEENYKLEDYFPEYAHFEQPQQLEKHLVVADEHPEITRAKTFILNEFIKITNEKLSDAMQKVYSYDLVTTRSNMTSSVPSPSPAPLLDDRVVYNEQNLKTDTADRRHSEQNKRTRSSVDAYSSTRLKTSYSYESKLAKQLKQTYREARDEAANGKFCIPYFTCAVDTDNIKRVFKACSHILKKEHLEKSGLL